MVTTDERVWRLLSDLNNAFKRDPYIDEFDFIPVLEPTQNRSPVVLVDHKLGLELWSVKILYQCAYHALMEWKTKKSCKFIEPLELASLSRAVLIINAECYTVWNIRKDLVKADDVGVLDDLNVSALVLTKHPKSSETFSHRRWLLRQFIDNHLQSSQGFVRSTGKVVDGFVNMEAIDLNMDSIQNILPAHNGNNNVLDVVSSAHDYHNQLSREIQVCASAADKYPCNYYAWSHRIWVLQHCYNCTTQILLSELSSMESWVSTHISDTCGFHYRQFLLHCLGTQPNNLREQFSINFHHLVQKEHRFIQNLTLTYIGHEAMWNYRRFTFSTLYKLYNMEGEKPTDSDDCVTENNLKKTKLDINQHVFGQVEIESVKKCELKSADPFHQKLAQSYLDWIDRLVIK